MGEALETLITLTKTLGLKEVKSKPEIFSFYLGIKIPSSVNVGKLVNDIHLMFVIDIVDNGVNILAFDLFMLGKPNAKRLYEVLKPYANVKIMDRETFMELRDKLIKEFPSIAKKQMMRKFPVKFFHSVYDVPVDKVVKTIDKFDVLYSLIR